MATKVFAAGCFNRIHKAHLQVLRTAKSFGDSLVVVLANDAHNRKPNAVASDIRLRQMRDLGIADRVIVGEAASFADTLRREAPQILVLGYDQRIPDEETEKAIEELGVEVIVLPWFAGKEE